uniref:Uncharacterized protein n=1 Tax=Vespula pensylvanica TaxID=30213 RepID=A0A834JV46_VESPE|nr:hypothetical protein H0235_016792 [Vespula pensylvanica]
MLYGPNAGPYRLLHLPPLFILSLDSPRVGPDGYSSLFDRRDTFYVRAPLATKIVHQDDESPYPITSTPSFTEWILKAIRNGSAKEKKKRL